MERRRPTSSWCEYRRNRASSLTHEENVEEPREEEKDCPTIASAEVLRKQAEKEIRQTEDGNADKHCLASGPHPLLAGGRGACCLVFGLGKETNGALVFYSSKELGNGVREK